MQVLPAVALDAEMTAFAVLARLAVHGVWRDPSDPGAREWLAEYAARAKTTPEAAAERLRRDPARVAIAIRRQWYANVLWYARWTPDVLRACLRAPPDLVLREVLDLHEEESQPPLPIPAPGEEPRAEGVVLDGGTPVAANVSPPVRKMKNGGGARATGDAGPATPRSVGFGNIDFLGGGGPMAAPPPTAAAPPPGAGPHPSAAPAAPAPAPEPEPIEAWPRIEAPASVRATVEFDVVVGLAKEKQPGVSGDRLAIQPPPGATTVDVDVDLVADGLDAPNGWTRRLTVPVADPTSAQVAFRLVGRVPAGPEPYHLTTLLVRYVYAGAVCGTASRALVIARPDASLAPPAGYGTPWTAQPACASAAPLVRDELAPDLTIEIAKPDGNHVAGSFKCLLSSPHPLSVAAGPYDIDLGEDARTFARRCVVDQLALYEGGPLADDALESIGSLVRDQLPAAALDALREVAERVKPEPPAVLIVTAEPYVPWELALVEPPLDPDRPPFLGAQALVGRWIRDPAASPASAAVGSLPATSRRPRPPPSPPGKITVRNMVVMAGVYARGSNLRPLPGAEQEKQQLVEDHDALPLDATAQAVSQLLGAKLVHASAKVGGADAMHFAGHGDFDPQNPDSSSFYLSNGVPLASQLFRNAKYGETQQPIAFLNACMIAIGGELLGDMGGFPGNCLKGGFGGVLGPLWAVNDFVASEFAVEFWKRVLPSKRSAAKPEPVGKVLRDLRAMYEPAHPVTTYLAYVFYGHPRLTLATA